MYVVVMDYAKGSTRTKAQERRHIEDVEGRKTLHDAGYVHGDIRWPNVLITGDG